MHQNDNNLFSLVNDPNMGTSPPPKDSPNNDPSFKLLEETKTILTKVESMGNIGHWEVDLLTGENTWSDQFFRILGLDSKSVVPSTELRFSMIHPEDLDMAITDFKKSYETGAPYKVEKRIIRPNGEVRYVISEGIAKLNDLGKPIRLFGIFKDITQEKAKEEELKKTNLQIENILNTTQDLIFLADENGVYQKVSKSCFAILGYRPDELIGKSFRDLIHPNDIQATIDIRKQILAGIATSDFKNRYFKKDGSIIHLNWSATLDQASKTVFAVARDITQLVLTREKLRLDRQKLSIVLDSSPETIWALDRNYNLITANQKFLRTLKQSGNWDIKTGDNLIFDAPLPEEFILDWKKWYDRAFSGEAFSVVIKTSLIKSGGYMEVYFNPIFEENEVVAIGCYSLDITQKIEEEKKKSELLDRLNLAQKIGKLGYWEYNIQSGEIYWTEEVYDIWGLDNTVFKPTIDLFLNTIHPDDQADFLFHHNKALKEKGSLDAIHRIRLATGEIKYIHEKGSIETDPKTGLERFRGTAQDITNEKKIEKELLERNLFIESTLKNLPLGIAVAKISTGETTFFNPAFAEIYGWPSDSLYEANHFFEKIFPNKAFRDTITTQIISDIQSGDPNRMIWKNIPIMTQSGKEKIISAKNILLPEQDIMISTVIDETDRYWAVHSLRTSNERFHLATQAVSDAIWDWDIKKKSIFWGKGYHNLFGYPEEMEQVSEDIWQSMIHPEDFPEISESIRAARNNKQTTRWSGQYRLKKFDGKYTDVKENTVILRNEAGEPYRIVGSLADISQEKQKTLELQKKTRLIAAISHIIHSFLETENWEELLQPTIKLMGETTGVDRVYFFKNFTDTASGSVYTRQTHEWTNGRVSSELDNLSTQAIPLDEHPITYKKALEGRPFTIKTKEAEEGLQQILQDQGIKSMVMMPVIVEDFFFGFMGFDNCTTDDSWTNDELGFLSSISTNLALAIERKQNLDKIREAFESRDSLLESIGDSFYAIDKDYKVTYWNNVVEKLTGIKRESILGKNIWDYIGKVNDEFKNTYEKVFLENKSHYFETFDSWVNAWLGVTIYPSNGGLSVIIKDITDRKTTENELLISNERFAILSDATNDALWDWNMETGEHFWGDGYQKLFGIDYKVEGKSLDFWENRVHPADLNAVKNNLDLILSSSNENYFEFEYRFRRQDNSYAFIVDKGSVIRNRDGKPIRIVGAMQDISHRKEYETSLQRLNKELAESNRELELSNKELEQFAYVASHDLQEPLRMISSFLGLIERKYAHGLDEKGLQYIHFAVDGAKRMKEIILDLLEFSRIGNLSGDKTWCHTPDLIKEVLVLNGKLINEKNAIIHVEPLPDIVCHPSTIIQLFQNLISNGLKYQTQDNVPEIWIKGEENENEWKFSVRDNGIGIDPNYQDKIFIIFQRLHLKEQFSGTGIGLAICKKIVEFHGGKIWVESTIGAGSIFYFTLKK
jgi:PAS domain S-box-containing protein